MYRLLGNSLPFRILKRIPLAILVNPFGMLLALLCFIAGLPLFLGNISPASIESVLPEPVARIWGFTIFMGALLQVVGGFIAHRRTNLPNSIMYQKGQALERIGLLMLGWASFVYSLCIIGWVGIGGLQSAAIIFAFALICWLQAFLIRIQFTLSYDIAKQYEDEMEGKTFQRPVEEDVDDAEREV